MRAALLAAAVLPASGAAATAPKNPCALVTSDDATAVLGSAVGPTRAQVVKSTVPASPLHLHHPMLACSYTARSATGMYAIVVSSRLDHTDFAGVIDAQPFPVKRIAGLGGLAYETGPNHLLMTWKHGTALYVSVGGTADRLAREKRLARRALARL